MIRYNLIQLDDSMKELLGTNMILVPKAEPEYIKIINPNTTNNIDFYFNGEKLEK